MIVAYDLRYAADHFTGIGTHAFSLLEAMLATPGDARFRVLWNPDLKQSRWDFGPVRGNPRVEWVERPLRPFGAADLFRLGSWLRETRPTVYFSPYHLLPIHPRCPCVLTVHDVRPLRLPRGLTWWQRSIFHMSLVRAARAQRIIAVSDFSRREIEDVLHLGNGRVRAVWNGVRSHPQNGKSRRPGALPDGAFALVVGDNRPHKNLSLLARTWATLGDAFGYRLVSAGPIDRRYPSLQQLAQSEGASNAQSLGWVDDAELEWLYDHATLVLHPSLYEGFGFPIVEAMAHGVPVLAADIPVLREVGQSFARYLPATRPEAWADEVRRLTGEPEERARLVEVGRVRVREFSYERSAGATLEVLREASARSTVLYDLRFAEDNFTGIATHAVSLLEALLALPGEERYLVLWNPRLRNTRFDFDHIRSNPRVTWLERPYAPLGVRALFQVGRLLRELKPSVYYSPFYFLPFGAGCPCVLTLHDVWPLRWPEGLKFWPRALYQLALVRAAQARAIVTSSEFSRSEIEELVAVEPGRVRVVRLGIPPLRGRLEARRPEKLPEGPFALVVGINKPHKNLATLAEAWARLGPTLPLRLVTAGPEDPRHPPLSRLAERHQAPAVTALGRVEESELEWLYQNATLVLFASLYEGFGLPLVEAFAHGVPVVASDIPTLREVGDGVARFVSPRDSVAWAEAVRELAGDPAARDRMRSAGLARAAELSYARTATETLAVLRDAAGAAA